MLTALALVAELGDFGRFRSAEELTSFVGLVPSEHSSGERQQRGSITKVGNAHVRRLLGDRDRATTPPELKASQASRPQAADAASHRENPRSLSAAPASGDPRP